MTYPLAIKDASVHAYGLAPQLALGLTVASHVFASRGVPCLITSLNDGTHAARSKRHPRSLHYDGRAADLRLASRYTGSAATDEALLLDLQRALGADFDVVLERDHFHLEWDPDSEPKQEIA